jgi:hypothetical protein
MIELYACRRMTHGSEKTLGQKTTMEALLSGIWKLPPAQMSILSPRFSWSLFINSKARKEKHIREIPAFDQLET